MQDTFYRTRDGELVYTADPAIAARLGVAGGQVVPPREAAAALRAGEQAAGWPGSADDLEVIAALREAAAGLPAGVLLVRNANGISKPLEAVSDREVAVAVDAARGFEADVD
jgi:hypothetical protein